MTYLGIFLFNLFIIINLWFFFAELNNNFDSDNGLMYLARQKAMGYPRARPGAK